MPDLKLPSDKYTFVSGNQEQWLGPCPDSFCFAGCSNPHCRYGYRLGKTPQLHNEALRKMHWEEKQAVEARAVQHAEQPNGVLPKAEEIVRSLQRHPELAVKVGELLKS